MFSIADFILDEVYGERLLISKQADQSELDENIRVDRDMHMADNKLKTKKIASGIYGRHEDFTGGIISECYVVHNSKAVVVRPNLFAASNKDIIKQLIEDEIEKLRT